MPDMEALDRAVEVGAENIWRALRHDALCGYRLGKDDDEITIEECTCWCAREFTDFEEAVSARARAEERERLEALVLAAEDGLGALAAMLFVEFPPREHALETMHWLQEVLIPYQADRALRAAAALPGVRDVGKRGN